MLCSMRRNYIKELQHLRNVDKVTFTNSSIRGKYQREQKEIKEYFEVFYFSPTEGLDEETCRIFNEYLTKLRNEFSNKLQTLNDLNQDLLRKVALIDESKKISEMNSEELIELCFAKEKDHLVVWRQIKKRFTDDALEKIADEEFTDIISEVTEREITTQVQKIQEESKLQMQNLTEKL